MKVLATIVVFIFFASCNSNNNTAKNDGNPIKTNKIQSIHDLKIDSVAYNKNKLYLYFTNFKDFYDPVTSEQKTIFALSNYELKGNEVDSIIINYNMPNRPDGNVEIITFPNYMITAREIYKEPIMNEVMNLILTQDSIDSAHHYLGGMNAEFALFTYGEQAVEEAFFGVNSLNVLYRYLNECRKSQFGPAHFVIEKYKDKIKTYDESERLVSEKLIELLVRECDK